MSQPASKPAPAPTERKGWAATDLDFAFVIDHELSMNPMARDAAQQLRNVPGVDAAFLDAPRIYVVTREHGAADREALIHIEDALTDRYGDEIIVCVRARQGRDVDSMLPGLQRIL